LNKASPKNYMSREWSK